MVFVSSIVSAALTAASFAGMAAAHPHPAPGSPAALKRAEFQTKARRSLTGCQSELNRRGGVYERAKARREAHAHKVRKARGLTSGVPFKRDVDTVLATSHHSNLTGVTNNTDAATLFTSNSSCVLQPEVTVGPYYVDGEYVRYDLREDQEGVDIYIDVQLIDVSTCEPVSDVYVDFWHANATGVYSGVVASGNGDSSVESNLNTTFLRGIQKTDEDGVAQWLSIFPGHYTGRTGHIHIVAHQNGTAFANGTYTSDTVSHVGQIFFDQDLISSVEALTPYSTNTQTLTTNEEDDILADEAEDTDPVLEYVLLGDDVSDGLMMWVSVGIDPSSAYTATAAATLTENGGVVNSDADSAAQMPAQSGSPSGSMPSGSMPSGSGAPSASPSA